jgi:hypothetical protein
MKTQVKLVPLTRHFDERGDADGGDDDNGGDDGGAAVVMVAVTNYF